jgi:2-phospho-L-lactate/phosphoenolpyruvate guanylyltransferase
MKYILIPVKDLSRAKQRLARLMSQEERTTLTGLMMQHVLEQVKHARGYDRAAVITLYDPAIRLANSLGLEIIREKKQISESLSVDYGSRVAHEAGATSVLRLPVDLPLIRAEDIEAVLSCQSEHSTDRFAVASPSRDGTGTNALGRTPPELFPSRFGPHSFERHRAEAQRCGAPFLEVHLPRIGCDIDDAADIAHLLDQGQDCTTRDYLTKLGIRERLKTAEDSALRTDPLGLQERQDVRHTGKVGN